MEWTWGFTRPTMSNFIYHLTPIRSSCIPSNQLRASEKSQKYRCLLFHQAAITLVKRLWISLKIARSRIYSTYLWYNCRVLPQRWGSGSMAQVQELDEKQLFSILGDSKEASVPQVQCLLFVCTDYMDQEVSQQLPIYFSTKDCIVIQPPPRKLQLQAGLISMPACCLLQNLALLDTVHCASQSHPPHLPCQWKQSVLWHKTVLY